MSGPTYEAPDDATLDDVRNARSSGDSAAASTALVGVTLGGSDPTGTEALCRELLDGPDRQLAGTAATCIGHLARLEGSLAPETVDRLRAHRSDPLIAGRVDDAFDDIETFTGARR